jgi:hypothetical protein
MKDGKLNPEEVALQEMMLSAYQNDISRFEFPIRSAAVVECNAK